ncbi:relaxase/mobilization nuclease domain-containing protein [Ruegeria sp. HKCCC1038]|uniref:relaxase/mobilization nuclease domain-containing protein n=1 Tax=Ruegeria sp. HKCCC1038 TaxID=2682982 RepID=UPI001489D4F4|nr:relaxase/mobilization nuclease domain-containing protein [Ruegeria sp. HKCCC1038]
MILKAKERGDGGQLARYLLSTRDNEHVELHEVSGFVSDDLLDAFHEADAIARGTRCKNYLFSTSLNPPEGAYVETEVFEKTADLIEKKLGLENQPRAIVFHEKDGRRHAHVVWSRIDSEKMRAINLPHYKTKLRDVSRSLYLEHGWDMPRGLQDRRLRDPLNFTREEWQKAKRAGIDPREIKVALQDAWKHSDSRGSFEAALKERGFWLARGDRRGCVALDYRGDVYSLSRYAGVKTIELEARLGNSEALPSAEHIKSTIAQTMTRKVQEFIKETEASARQRFAMLDFRKTEMVARHKEERAKLNNGHEKRWQAESEQRARRLPSGFSGIWHRLTGQYAKIKDQNERETLLAWQRDRAEKDTLIFKQIEERERLQRDIKRQRRLASGELMQLRKDVANYREIERPDPERGREEERRLSRQRTRRPSGP